MPETVRQQQQEQPSRKPPESLIKFGEEVEKLSKRYKDTDSKINLKTVDRDIQKVKELNKIKTNANWRSIYPDTFKKIDEILTSTEAKIDKHKTRLMKDTEKKKGNNEFKNLFKLAVRPSNGNQIPNNNKSTPDNPRNSLKHNTSQSPNKKKPSRRKPRI